MEISKLDNGNFKVVKMVEQVTEITEHDLRVKLNELTETLEVSQNQLDTLDLECEKKYEEVDKTRVLLEKIIKVINKTEEQIIEELQQGLNTEKVTE